MSDSTPERITLATLAPLPCWVAWQTELREATDEKPTKVPRNPRTGGKARPDLSTTWGTRDAAERRAALLPKPYNQGGVGIGFCSLAHGRSTGGADLDSCRDAVTGAIEPWAQAVIDRLATYTEVSPSGTGVKLFFTFSTLAHEEIRKAFGAGAGGKLKWGATWMRRTGMDHPPAIELHTGNKYFTVTDQRLKDSTDELRELPVADLLHLIRVVGPDFRTSAAQPNLADKVGPRKARKAAISCGTDTSAASPREAIQLLPGPDGLRGRIDGKASLTPRLLKRWQGDWSGLSDQTRSGMAFALAAALRKAGFDKGDTFAGLRMHPDTAPWMVEKGDAGGGREIDRIWKHLEDNYLPPPAQWIEKCQTTERGEPLANISNAMVALRDDEVLCDAFAYDEMLRAGIVVARLPGDEPGPDHTLRPITDCDVSKVQEFLQLAGLRKLGKDTTHQAVDLRASERSFHPVREYLDGLRWDGTKRLRRWLIDYMGAAETPYAQGIGILFMVCAVARIYEPGCKADYMLVLEGDQGIKKSTACSILAGPWYSDSLPDLRTGGKDVAQHLNGKWMIEVGEMSALDKADAAALKAFVTRTVERYRPSFGRKEVIEPRQCVFIGTTNKEAYLRDETGGRRFWPVRVLFVKTEELIRDRDQLFAEAVVLHRAGQQWWPTSGFEQEHIKEQQEKRYEADAWEGMIGTYLSMRHAGVQVIDVARDALFIETPKLGTADQRRIAAAMERLGWERGARGAHGERFWQRRAA